MGGGRHHAVQVGVGKNWGREKKKKEIKMEIKKRAHLLVLVHWHRYGVAGFHSRREKLGLGMAVIHREVSTRWCWGGGGRHCP